MTAQEGPAVKPWYREFWPWFIIVLMSSVVIASLFTVVLAFKHNDEPALGHYMRDGLGVVDSKNSDDRNTSKARESGE
ncbi:MAG: hypothetical protein AB8B86_16600 [Pseudomonadales bacterium]